MKNIKLTQGKMAQVDDDTYAWAKDFKWCAKKHRKTFYAVRHTIGSSDRRNVSIHQCVTGLSLAAGLVIDHIDGNGLNNQRSNLRIISARDNSRNNHRRRAGLPVGATLKPGGRWQSRAMVDGKRVHVGMFATREEASKAAMDLEQCNA